MCIRDRDNSRDLKNAVLRVAEARAAYGIQRYRLGIAQADTGQARDQATWRA